MVQPGRVAPNALATTLWEQHRKQGVADHRLRDAGRQVIAQQEGQEATDRPRLTRSLASSGAMSQQAITEKVTSLWANITVVTRKREEEAEKRRKEEAQHEDMVEQLKIRVSKYHGSASGGVMIIGDRRSSAASASPNRDFSVSRQGTANGLSQSVRDLVNVARRSGEDNNPVISRGQSRSGSVSDNERVAALAAQMVQEKRRSRLVSCLVTLEDAVLGDRAARRGHRVLYHKGAFRRALYVLTLCAAAYSAVIVPFDFAFHPLAPSPALASLDGLVRGIFGLDFLLAFVTTYPNSRTDEIVASPVLIITHYLRSPWATLDLIAALPLPQVIVAAGASPTVAKLVAFTATLKMIKVQALTRHIGMNARNAQLLSALGMLRLLLLVLLLAHWIGCFFWFTEVIILGSRRDATNATHVVDAGISDEWLSSSWLISNGFAEPPTMGDSGRVTLPLHYAYAVSVSSAFYFLAGSIDGAMLTVGERGFAAGMMMVGSVLTAFMVSQLSMLMQQMNASHRFYRTHMHSVQLMMEKQNLPRELRNRVEQYYSYLWHAHGTFELSGAKFKNLSPALLTEINIYLHRDMVQKVPFFATCSPAVVQAVVQRLVPEVYLEGDFVIHHNDVNSAMYFITRGECGVLIPEPGKSNVLRKVKTLSRGDYFGELSLLDEHAVASAFILAETFVDLKALYRHDFDVIKVTYPDLIIEMHKSAARSAYVEMHRDEETGALESRQKEYYSNVMSQLALSEIGFSARLIQMIAERVQPLSFEAGDAIIRLREPSMGVFFITEGTAQVMSPNTADTNRNVLVRSLHPGDYFGELSLIRGQLATANVFALTQCKCAVLYKVDYDQIKIDFPELPLKLEAAITVKAYQQLSPFLAEVALFRHLSERDVRQIVAKLKRVVVEPGTCVVREGEPISTLVLVGEGTFVASVGMKPNEYVPGTTLTTETTASLLSRYERDHMRGGTAMQDGAKSGLRLSRAQRASSSSESEAVGPASPSSPLANFFTSMGMRSRRNSEQRDPSDMRDLLPSPSPSPPQAGAASENGGDMGGASPAKSEPGSSPKHSRGKRVSHEGVVQDERRSSTSSLDPLRRLSEEPRRPSLKDHTRSNSVLPARPSLLGDRRSSNPAPTGTEPPPRPMLGKMASFSSFGRSAAKLLFNPDRSSTNSDGDTPPNTRKGVVMRRTASGRVRTGLSDDANSRRSSLNDERSSVERFSLAQIENLNQRERDDQRRNSFSSETGVPKILDEAMVPSTWPQRGVKVLREGESFGEGALVEPNSTAEATLRAAPDNTHPCTLFVLPCAAYQLLVKEVPALATAAQHTRTHSAFATCQFLVQQASLFTQTGISDVSTELLQELASKLKPMVCSDGQQLIKKGRPSVGLFIVRTGEAHCFIDDPADPTQLKLVKKIGAGGHFGELSLIEPGRETAAHVHAYGKGTEVLLLTPARYEEICSRFADFRQILLASMPAYATFNFFVGCRLLRGMSHELVQAVTKAAKVEMHASGTVVLSRGGALRACFFVQRGRLRKTVYGSDGTEMEDIELGVGDHFGMVLGDATNVDPSADGAGALTPVEPVGTSGAAANVAHHAEVACLSDSFLLAVSVDDLLALGNAHPQLVTLMQKASQEEVLKSVDGSANNSFRGGAQNGGSGTAGGGGGGVSGHVHSQLGGLQRTLDDLSTRLNSLELEVNRSRAAHERSESRLAESVNQVLQRLHDMGASRGLGAQGAPAMMSSFDRRRRSSDTQMGGMFPGFGQ